jgi:hypothetical protein
MKAYNIATSVFDRDERFDPESDPIVRVEASRLRRSEVGLGRGGDRRR